MSLNHNYRAAFNRSHQLHQNEPPVAAESFLFCRNQSPWSPRRWSPWGYLCRKLLLQIPEQIQPSASGSNSFNGGGSSSAASLHQQVNTAVNYCSLQWSNAAPCPLPSFRKMQILCDRRKRTPRAAAAFSSMTDRLIVAQNEFGKMNRALPLPRYSRFSW